MCKIAIFDDEKIIVDYVENLIKKYVMKNVKIYKYIDISDLRNDFKNGNLGDLDILYIDIKIGKADGITIAEKMQKSNPNLRVIFMTAYTEYSEEIFRVIPTYLLLKPIKEEKFKKSLEKALEYKEHDKNLIRTFCIKGKIFNIKIDNIKYIESNRRIATIHEKDIDRNIYAKLSELEELLPEQFIRCHQSYIVNLEQARELNSHEFVLNTGERIPISQTKYNKSKQFFIKYLGDIE